MHVIYPTIFPHSVKSSFYEFIYTVKYIFASLRKSLTRNKCPRALPQPAVTHENLGLSYSSDCFFKGLHIF